GFKENLSCCIGLIFYSTGAKSVSWVSIRNVEMSNPKITLGIKLPFLVIIKNLENNYQSMTRLQPFICTMLMRHQLQKDPASADSCKLPHSKGVFYRPALLRW
uniref:Uncharacterized protein n=1 Tax=Gouania willdenowi TaxID=441366 RepID=A0A8C5EVL9_GOUWI